MSRIGKKPVEIPQGVSIDAADGRVTVKGPKGELSIPVPATVKVSLADGKLAVERAGGDDKQARADHGTVRALVANMVRGVTQGYVKELEIQGVGYRASMEGTTLTMLVGYSHPVVYPVPEGVKLTVSDSTNLKLEGIDKQLVGEVAARIRAFCPPEPYKGKGIRYKDEHVRRKAGKTVA
ncbi:MAG: 50S ribosomal protein L6 [Kiritimatiellae bacterium]|nr:50S ribosomal protein L6 [Kiritimatiellia bacterium]